jgi:hypothetical protein
MKKKERPLEFVQEKRRENLQSRSGFLNVTKNVLSAKYLIAGKVDAIILHVLVGGNFMSNFVEKLLRVHLQKVERVRNKTTLLCIAKDSILPA